MSHTVKVKTQIRVSEHNQLVKALQRLGWNVAENAAVRQYAGVSNDYPLAAINPDKSGIGYDVGIKQKDGVYEFFTDFYQGSVAKTLGEDFSKLKQEFAAAVVEDEFPNATVTRNVAENGDILLEVESWG